jgi:hypothetical protein
MTLRATDEQGAVLVRSQDTEIVRYRAETGASKPHVDTLALPPGTTGAGRNLVDAAPHDHPWHLGLFFCQKLVDGINCWESEQYARRDRLHGAARSVSCGRSTGEQVSISDEVSWHTSDGEHLLDDERTVAVHPPDDDGYVLEWTQTLRAVDETRRLGSETLHGHYSGLSIRCCRSLTGATVRFPDDGTDESPADELNGSAARWADYTGPLDGFVGPDPPPTAGMTIFDHPNHDPFPTRWFVMTEPFGFLAANPTWDRVETLDPDEEVSRKWGVWVHAGSPSRDRIDSVYEQFTGSG